MSNHRTYLRAPITEALIDLRVRYGPDISLEKLRRFGAEIKDEYPNEGVRDVVQGQIAVSVGSAPHAQASRTTVGYIFHSSDRLQAVQARLDGFTFSRFTPYQDWPHLVSEARRLWTAFVRVVQPLEVTRVAVRYINQINLPLEEGGLKFEDYLRTFVTIGVDGDVDLEQFLIRLVMPQTDLPAQLILTEALLPAQGGMLPLILDIDLFREGLSLDVRSGEVWDTLEMFRDRKNSYFEGSITDATRSLFE